MMRYVETIILYLAAATCIALTLYGIMKIMASILL